MTETASGAASRGGGKAHKGLTIQRIHTREGVHPYDEVTWERRDVVMTNWRDGTVNFEQHGSQGTLTLTHAEGKQNKLALPVRGIRSAPAASQAELAFDKGGTSGAILGCAAVLGAAITAFYMTRVMFMTFAGQRRWEAGAHPHEAPPVMTVPMVLLAVGSIGAGAFLILGQYVQLRPVNAGDDQIAHLRGRLATGQPVDIDPLDAQQLLR